MRLVLSLLFSLLCFSAGVFGIHRPLHSSARFVSQSQSQSRSLSSDPIYYYRTEWYSQVLDHFSFASTSTFWNQKILINDTYWAPGQPIFLYAGNEGKIETFADNSGFMWDIMQEFGAALIFPEHRYYGSSMPINNSVAQSYANPDATQYLTAEQALADYAEYIQYWKKIRNAPSSPVVVFGGSYGGMLAAWFRLKYPHIIAGAIAASAPIFQFDGMVDPKAFNAIVSRDIRGANPYCGPGVEKTWTILRDLAQTQRGRDEIQSIFHICLPLTNSVNVTGTLFSWLVNAWTSMAMGDYPYSASFLGGMPPNPINASCSYFTEEALQSNQTILAAHYAAASIYYNYTAQLGSCFNLTNGDIPTLGDTSDLGWNYQSCTEMVMPIGQYGYPNDVFDPAHWSTDAAIASCQANYGITPRPHWVETHFTGLDLSAASNIVFTNGNLDPWSAGGVLSNWSDTVVSYIIEGGAHHLDLRHADPADPPSVRWVRQMQKVHIRNWIYGKSSDNTIPTKWAVFIAILATAAVIVFGYKAYQYYEENDPSKPSNKSAAAPAPVAVSERKDSVVVETIEHYPPSNAAAINNNGYAPLTNQIV